MVYPNEITEAFRSQAWKVVIEACHEKLSVEPTSFLYLRLRGLALEGLSRTPSPRIPRGYEAFHEDDAIKRRLLFAALDSYDRSLDIAATDEIAVSGSRRLRTELGLPLERAAGHGQRPEHRKTGCWFCKGLVTDALGDNDGRCLTCGWLRCIRCGACKVYPDHENPTDQWQATT